jgi:hypothetical protein
LHADYLTAELNRAKNRLGNKAKGYADQGFRDNQQGQGENIRRQGDVREFQDRKANQGQGQGDHHLDIHRHPFPPEQGYGTEYPCQATEHQGKERLVVTLYYYEELNLKEIGEIMSLTESRISQLHSQAVIRLKVKMKNMAG